MPAASLGQYASLSFVVIGRRGNWDLGVGFQVSGKQNKKSETLILNTEH